MTTSQQSAARPRALVTGASSGLGWAFAEALAQRGYDLTLVARRRERLEALATQLQQEAGILAEVLVADLAQPAQLQLVEQQAASDDSLAFLVNNAGFAAYMPFVELDPDRAEEQIQLHLTALVRLTRAALPGMLARQRGTIVNVSSGLAYSAAVPPTPLPYRATYAASKAYINVFSEQLQHELQGTGVQVQALCPGRVATEFHAVAGVDLSHLTGRTMTAAEVVQASLVGLELGEVLCIPGLADTAALEQNRASNAQLLAAVRAGELAARYTGGSA